MPVCLLTLCSYIYIFEPWYISPEDLEGVFQLTSENSYAVQQDDGTYNIYYNDDYLENTDSLEYYPDDMVVYYNDNNEGVEIEKN